MKRIKIFKKWNVFILDYGIDYKSSYEEDSNESINNELELRVI